jgi:uncharacterized membrane protein
MSFCQTCGTSLPAGSLTCPACGAAQGVAPASAPPGYVPGAIPPQPLSVAGTGLTPNLAGALAYLVGLITGILFLVIDPFKNDRFVRFHAFQSIFFNVAWIVISILWSIVGFMLLAVSHGLFIIIVGPIHMLIALAGFCLWLYLMYAAYQGKMVQLPIIGAMAASQSGNAPVGTGQRL